MKTSTLILISTIFSFIYVILDFYGIIRYILLHVLKPSKYIPSYRSLDSGSSDRVVISIATTPERISKITPVINSLLDQTVKVDIITLNVPYGDYVLPKGLEDAVMLYKSKDYGKLTAVTPVIAREGERDTNIIVLEDDVIYGKDFIETLLNESKKFPKKIISTSNIFKNFLIKTNFVSDDDWFEKTEKKYLKYDENFKRI